MMLQFADERKLKRTIITLPVMTPKLSSYWLYFVTSTFYPLAQNLVDSMKVNVICRPNNLAQDLGIKLLSYREFVAIAFQKIEQNEVLSSWKDAFSAFDTKTSISKNVEVPTYGCFKDVKQADITGRQQAVFYSIWEIGGEKEWSYRATRYGKRADFWTKHLEVLDCAAAERIHLHCMPETASISGVYWWQTDNITDYCYTLK